MNNEETILRECQEMANQLLDTATIWINQKKADLWLVQMFPLTLGACIEEDVSLGDALSRLREKIKVAFTTKTEKELKELLDKAEVARKTANDFNDKAQALRELQGRF